MEQRTPCKHFWKCEDAVGLRSKAKCALCGEEREFDNHMPYEYGTTVHKMMSEFWEPFIPKKAIVLPRFKDIDD